MFELFICIAASLGAGVTAGLAGISTATVISPLLIALLGFDAYEALGIALAADVLSSALAAVTYGRQKHILYKKSLLVLIPAALFTLLGSYVGYSVSRGFLSYLSLIGMILMGVKFLTKPVKEENQPLRFVNSRPREVLCHLGTGVIIGSICGFCGVGGGMMMLLIFTVLLGYDMKSAVGTSIFIMTFIAAVGAVSHYAFIGTAHHITALAVCVVTTPIAAVIAARYANRVSNRVLNLAVGVSLSMIGALLLLIHAFG
ncbi:MAG: sulfite exporter TauE/SafE family protein [Clostridiales bacterium]|nr:sulfite exporter TauE/SafE family protein [Clostridiales bacterium]